MVDWSIAKRVAEFAARSDGPSAPDVDLAALVAEFEPRVSEYTGLVPVGASPPPELVSRQEWAEANLSTMAEIFGPIEDRLGGQLSGTGAFAGVLRSGAGAVVAAEIGLLMGYMSQRVLGQYELSLIAGTAKPRLLFVGPNLVGAAKTMDVDEEAFVRWVTVHELTHAMQFGGVPWLREYMGGLLKELLATLNLDEDEAGAASEDESPEEVAEIEDAAEAPANGTRPAFSNRSGGLLGGLLDRLGEIDLPDPAELAERFRDGGIGGLMQSDEQRVVMDRMQAAMAVIEGHAEHVMDALAPELVPQHDGLRVAMDERRRNRSTAERMLMRLLGMEMKMRQYKVGKEFCDAVVAEGGIEGLSRVWAGPEALPTLEELERPADWLARQAPAPKA